MATGAPWSREEVEAIVADYFHMLTLELAGQNYSKTVHRRRLAGILAARSESSIERKHQNISAILLELNCPCISGYKPLPNYQSLLFDVVAQRIERDTAFDRLALEAVERPAVAPLGQEVNDVLVDPPVITQPLAADETAPYRLRERGVFRDYLAREANNRSLGEAGESFVLDYEQRRLRALGRSRLSDRIEQVSKTKGDGLGYDILSFETSGEERFIEVKTTAFSNMTPFYVTRPELERSRQCAEQFRLYRIFDFRSRPRMFALPGDLKAHCTLDPVNYLARLS